MLFDIIGNLILSPIDALLQLLPAAGTFAPGMNTLATNITTSSYWPNLGWANDYVPIGLAITCITTIISVLLVSLLIRMGLWVYHQFWGS